MPQCLDNMYQQGYYGADIDVESMAVPSPAVDICPGDFLVADTSVAGITEAKLLSAFTWTTNLATTRTNAKAAFRGVSAGEYGTEDCIQQEDCLPYWRYNKGNGWLRSYLIADDAGAAAPTTWHAGQLFTFAKNPSSNALVNNKIVKTSDASVAVFRAPNASGTEDQTRAMVEFY